MYNSKSIILLVRNRMGSGRVRNAFWFQELVEGRMSKNIKNCSNLDRPFNESFSFTFISAERRGGGCEVLRWRPIILFFSVIFHFFYWGLCIFFFWSSHFVTSRKSQFFCSTSHSSHVIYTFFKGWKTSRLLSSFREKCFSVGGEFSSNPPHLLFSTIIF